MSELPDAHEIVLRKTRKAAPPFHEHIARSKLRGSACRTGDTVVVYEVISTNPDGPVLVTRDTVIRFE